MGLFKNIVGIISATFQVGGTAGAKLKNSSAVLEARNAADNDYTTFRVLRLGASPGINDVPVSIDSQVKVIQFSFNGASPPSAGDNTGKYGFCHTTGGSYTANDVVYDTGSALLVMPRATCAVIVTTDAVSGTVSLNADGVYGWEGSAYVLKGDGAASDTGLVKCIKVALAFGSGATVDSTTSIPNGAFVTRVAVVVGTLFNGTAPTLAVSINGSSPLAVMTTGENNLKLANQYEVEDVFTIGATETGVVRLSYTASGSSAGAANVFVFYTTPNA